MIEFVYPHTHLVAGVDEVGRGPLVGAVVTAAVILDPVSYTHLRLRFATTLSITKPLASVRPSLPLVLSRTSFLPSLPTGWCLSSVSLVSVRLLVK